MEPAQAQYYLEQGLTGVKRLVAELRRVAVAGLTAVLLQRVVTLRREAVLRRGVEAVLGRASAALLRVVEPVCQHLDEARFWKLALYHLSYVTWTLFVTFSQLLARCHR